MKRVNFGLWWCILGMASVAIGNEYIESQIVRFLFGMLIGIGIYYSDKYIPKEKISGNKET